MALEFYIWEFLKILGFLLVLIVSQYIREFPIIEEYGTSFSVPVLLIYDNRGPNNQGLPVVGK